MHRMTGMRQNERGGGMSRLTHDINQYGVMIQPKANTTLKAMTKAELIEYIRTLEHNYNVAVDFNEWQARNVEAELKKWQHYKDLEEQGRLIVQKHGRWKIIGMRPVGTHLTHYCSICGGHGDNEMDYCPNCGAKMDEVE